MSIRTHSHIRYDGGMSAEAFEQQAALIALRHVLEAQHGSETITEDTAAFIANQAYLIAEAMSERHGPDGVPRFQREG